MSAIDAHLLSWIIFLPLLGAVALLFLPRNSEAVTRVLTMTVAVADFLLSLRLLQSFDPHGGFQFVERVAWIPRYGIDYSLGVDGINLWLVILTTFLAPIVVLSTWSAIRTRVREFMIFLLLLQVAMLGTLCARDVVLFYIFWEAMLLPMALLIGIWGGQRRIYAAIKFVLYTAVGSLLMLVAIFYMYGKAGSFALDAFLSAELSHVEQLWLFGAFALAFAIKVPVFPLHTWLPDAHVEAPTAGSVVLAGVLLKMGTYGLLRFAIPLFPLAVVAFQPWMAALGVVGIIYGALVAMVQRDVKKLVAYSSVSHLGFVVLGLFALTTESLAGAMFVMLAHGLSTGALFLLVGNIYERRHTRSIADFGGLAHAMPIYTFFFLFATLASIGLPGLSGFVGEFLVLLGSFQSASLPHAQLWVALAAVGVILSAVYMLWMVQRVFFGPNDKPDNQSLSDLNLREILVMVPLAILIVWMGVYPRPWLARMEPSLDAVVSAHERAVESHAAMATLTVEERP
ncbi:MAG TPA: NADH-quinone oxidoreductase subunit M [Candidatus Krumholzibacteria bacterium]|jgi:NADH-quinone oxidoreductase subunit M